MKWYEAKTVEERTRLYEEKVALEEEKAPRFVEELKDLLDKYGYRLSTNYVVGNPIFVNELGDQYFLDGQKVEPR